MTGQALAGMLPRSRTRSVSALALFAAVQAADALMTWAGIQRFGFAAEGNPVLSFYMAAFGVGVTLVVAKSVALALAVVLHLRQQHLVLVVLTLVYVAAAIAPWVWLSSF